jgi:Outer membrane protein beta-barrel domain
MQTRSSLCKAALGCAPLLAPIPAEADEFRRLEIGAHLGTTLAAGVPANDIPGYGIFGLYRLNDRWAIGVGLDRTEFDYEEPARLIGIPLDPDLEPIDAVVEGTILSVRLERTFSAPESRTEWFVGGGLGASSVDVPTVTGPTLAGGTFEVRTRADTEVIVSLLGGVRRRLGERWFVQFTLRGDQHFADWTSVDEVSGGTREIDEYFAYGGYLGFGYRF